MSHRIRIATGFTILLLLALVAQQAQAVTVVGDLPDQTTTHCQFRFDGGAWGADTPVVTISGTRLCAVDISGIAEGAHTVDAKAVKQDALWGRLESAPSVPFAFTRPAAPASPTGTRLVP
jgi:hypothetical protein